MNKKGNQLQIYQNVSYITVGIINTSHMKVTCKWKFVTVFAKEVLNGTFGISRNSILKYQNHCNSLVLACWIYSITRGVI